MDVEFGWSLDGAAWSGKGRAASGRAVMGPRALLALLRTRLGLTGPDVDPQLRVAQYEQRLRSVRHSWAASSLEADSWGTARAVLALRDAAVSAGWDGRATATDPLRLRALRTVELAPAAGGIPRLAAGPADHLAELAAELSAVVADAATTGEEWPIGLDTLWCRENPRDLPGLWPGIIADLRAAGVDVRVGRPDAGIADAAPEPPELIVVDAEREWDAAEATAQFLRAVTPTEPDRPPSDVTVLATAPTVVLDQQLARRGLPALGQAEPSAMRAKNQLISLFLEIVTAPVDVRQVAAFLDVRFSAVDAEPAEDKGPTGISLLPARAREHLLDAIASQAGFGRDWQAAVQTIREEETPARAELVTTLDRFIRTSPIVPGADGTLATDELDERLDWLAARLRSLNAGQDLSAPLAHLATLREILRLSPRIAPLQLRRITASVAGRGASPFQRPQVVPWTVITNPAHSREVDTLVWWGCDDTGGPMPPEWDTSEAEALARHGAHVVAPDAIARLETAARLSGLLSARRIIAIHTTRRDEEEQDPDPLLVHVAREIGTRTGRSLDDVLRDARVRTADLCSPSPGVQAGPDTQEAPGSPDAPRAEAGTWSLAGASLPVDPVPVRVPSYRADLTRHVAGGAALLPERLSYSQVENLIGCPLRWTYDKPLQIRAGRVSRVQQGNAMIGTLVHAVLENLDRAALPPSGIPEDAAVGAVFDALAPQYAAELLLPGHARELARLREAAIAAITELFRALVAAGMTMTGAESDFEWPLEADVDGSPRAMTFIGSRDVDARDAEGRRVVIDLKWTNSRKHHRELFTAGESLQLASYAWSVQQETGRPPSAVAYYLLKQRRFVSDDPRLAGRDTPAVPLDDLWERQRGAIAHVLGEISAGEVAAPPGQLLRAAGFDDLETPDDLFAAATGTSARSKTAQALAAGAKADALTDGRVQVLSACHYCDFSLLCGVRGDAS